MCLGKGSEGKEKLRLSKVKNFTGSWQYVPDTKERNPRADTEDL